MSADNGRSDNLVNAVGEVSDRVSNLVREEIELAKAEVTIKAKSLLRGTVAVLAGAVFGVFAIFIGLEALAWALNAILVPGAGSIWEGFLIVFGVLAILTIASFLFAWTKLKAGAPPAPTMAIDEAKRIRETVSSGPRSEADAAVDAHARADPRLDRAEPPRARPLAREAPPEVTELTDWRGQIRRHQREVLIGAGIAGFVLGGGIAALGALAFGRGRRRQLGR